MSACEGLSRDMWGEKWDPVSRKFCKSFSERCTGSRGEKLSEKKDSHSKTSRIWLAREGFFNF